MAEPSGYSGVVGYAVVGLGVVGIDYSLQTIEASTVAEQNTVKTQPTIIQKGDSLPFVFDRGGLSIDGFICTIFAKRYPGDVGLIARVVEPVGRTWPGFLTKDETLAFTGGRQYMLVGQLVNDTTLEEAKPPVKFYVAEAWA